MSRSGTCRKCGASDFGLYTSSTTGKVSRYCRPCRRVRAATHTNHRLANGGTHTRLQWLQKLAVYAACPGCSTLWSEIPSRPDRRYRYVWTKDHVTPLSKGGTNDISNIQPMCYRCNSAKCNGRGKHAEPRASADPGLDGDS